MSGRRSKKVKKPAKGASPGLAHIEHPAAVINLVDPCLVENACDVLEVFEQELYPSDPNTNPVDRKFNVVFTRVGSKNEPLERRALLATAVFPREGVSRLAEICWNSGLVLIRGGLTMVDAETQKQHVFDYKMPVAHVIDTIPAAEDVYTFGIRTPETNPGPSHIICGHQDSELNASPH